MKHLNIPLEIDRDTLVENLIMNNYNDNDDSDESLPDLDDILDYLKRHPGQSISL
jgi:hypothetical protein